MLKELFNDKREILAAICSAFIGLITLLVIFGYTTDQDDKLKEYEINFNGEINFKNDELTAIVNNTNNGGFISIYGLNRSQSYFIHPTYLAGQKGNELILQGDDFKVISNAEPIVLKISPSSEKSGSYDGWVLIRTDKSLLTSISITAETEPLMLLATLWVLVGIFLSLTLWELIKYFKRKEAESKKKALQEEANTLTTQVTDLRVAGAPDISAQYYIDILNTDVFQKLQESAIWGEIASNLSSRWSKWKSFFRIIILEFGTIAFGIAVGLLGIYSNASVTNLLSIGVHEILILLGLGLGIGSLKELIDKPG